MPSSKGPLPAAHKEAAAKLRNFFSTKTEVTAEQFKKVTCFADLQEHTGITADDAKKVMEAADDGEAAKKTADDGEAGKMAADHGEVAEKAADDTVDKEKTVVDGRWTKVKKMTTVRGGEVSLETITKYESELLYFEVLKDLPESLTFKMDKAFKAIEKADDGADGAVKPPPPKRHKKADKVAKEAEKEEMKAQLAKLVDEAKALEQKIASQ